MARDKRLPPSKKDRVRQKQQQKAKKPLAVGRILIVCEGEKTEPNYFKWWQKQLENIKGAAKTKAVGDIDVKSFADEIQIMGEGKNTNSLVKKAIELKNQANYGKINYTQIWCVFDRDSFPAENYNLAIEKARSNDFKVAYSNEAFELWYLLHFDYVNTAISRKQYKTMLTERLGEKYNKNDSVMYEKLHQHPKASQQEAIENAKKLLNQQPGDYAVQNPSTTVFELVDSLNDHVWRFRCQIAPAYSLPYPYDCSECQKSTQSSPPYPCLESS
jgi:hypothetical protein